MIETFGTMPDGSQVERIRLRGGGLTASLLTYGSVLQDLRFEGHDAPLVLGFPEFAPYLTHSPNFGTMAGRCANRVRDGHAELDGIIYQLDRNFVGKHMLHGGAEGTGKQCWQITDHSENSVTLCISLPDGHMGFPGTIDIKTVFSLLEGGVLDIVVRAQTDATTLCSVAHHSYFNLDGGETISDHLLWVDADHFLPVDDELIPTGKRQSVEGTGFDFRTPAPVRQAHPVDNNFCLSTTRETLRKVARLYSPKSAISMECRTTEPGLQVYDGSKLNIDLPGLNGAPMHAFAGIAMEPQVWPDANHHEDFPSAILRPGETYQQQTQYVFSREAG